MPGSYEHPRSLAREATDKPWCLPAWRLILWLAAVAVVWCVVLPQVARRESISQYLELLDHHRIDASAKFYTDLEFMRSSQ